MTKHVLAYKFALVPATISQLKKEQDDSQRGKAVGQASLVLVLVAHAPPQQRTHGADGTNHPTCLGDSVLYGWRTATATTFSFVLA
jgi:hypothetical protein